MLGQIEKILYDHAVPIIMMGEHDVILFKDDPQEFVRKQTDFTESFTTPKQSMIDLVTHIMGVYPTMKAEERPKGEKPLYLQPFL